MIQGLEAIQTIDFDSDFDNEVCIILDVTWIRVFGPPSDTLVGLRDLSSSACKFHFRLNVREQHITQSAPALQTFSITQEIADVVFGGRRKWIRGRF